MTDLAQYELMYILKPDLGEEAQQSAIEKVEQIVEGAGGTVEKTDKWGRRKLAYAIDDFTEGFYVVVNFSGDGAIANEITRLLNINEEVIRSMVVRLDD
ncbi:30S ribosomal protein S6 [Sulfobacillus harzensis]|uniref:30S ribosomal protein S6 n=1 Tax=Sulfobacillus harzensis TaxID=2729629 RepID=UPI0030840033